MADKQTNVQSENKVSKPAYWRRRLVPLSLALVAIGLLLMPWSASVGNYGTLNAVPQQETILRAPDSATLVTLRVQPGDQVAAGAILGQMGNLDVEEQVVQVQAELARANADYDRLRGELRTREEAAERASKQLQQRQYEYDESEAERRQIAVRHGLEPNAIRVTAISTAPNYELATAQYPPALAALQAEVDEWSARLSEATVQRDRVRTLHAHGILPRIQMDAEETRAMTLASALAAASQRLDAALIEHRRKHTSTLTNLDMARLDLSTEHMQVAKLNSELNGMRELMRTLEARRDLLSRKRAQFELVAARDGAIFGEELPRLVGQYFQKDTELGFSESYHPLSHHQNDPGKIAKVTQIDVLHTKMLAYYLDRLQSTPDGDGSLLDNVMMVYGSAMSDGNLHIHNDLPVLLIGGGSGKIKGGRHVRYPVDTPLTNLFIALLDKLDIAVEKLGDSTGRLEV